MVGSITVVRALVPTRSHVARGAVGLTIVWSWMALATVAPAADAEPPEIWEAFYLQDAKIGYGKTTVKPVTIDGKPRLQIDTYSKFSIKRFGQRTDQEVKLSSLETPEGGLLSFKSELSAGPAAVITTGKLEGGKMVLENQTQGRKDSLSIPWSDDVLGMRGVEQSLERKPLKPGETRKLKTLMALVNQIVEVDLTARDYEMTSVLGVDTKLLKIDTVTHLPGSPMKTTVWIDAAGQAIKSRVDGLNQVSYRTTRELALSESEGDTKLDVGTTSIVKVKPPLKDPGKTKLVRYRVELSGDDPAKVFAVGPTQSVRSIDEHTAEIMVKSIRPADAPSAKADKPPGKEYTSANPTLQIDDPRVKALAAEAKGTLSEPVEVALALERYVNRAIDKKNFSHAFATAAEVAESREGDCTEHAVLLTALARDCGIASRVAMGLVYDPGLGGFAYHMWSEMYLNGQWIPLDATTGRAGISAAYLKIADSSLEGTSAYSSFLPVARVLGQLKISVISAE